MIDKTGGRLREGDTVKGEIREREREDGWEHGGNLRLTLWHWKAATGEKERLERWREGKKKTWEIVAKCEKMRRDMWHDREEEEEEEEVKWWGTQVFRLDSASESLESEEWLFDICKSTRKEKKRNKTLFLSSWWKLLFPQAENDKSMLYWVFLSPRPRRLIKLPFAFQETGKLHSCWKAVTRSSSSSIEPGWWWSGCSALITTLAGWTRLKSHWTFHFCFLYLFSYYCCCFHMSGGLRDAEAYLWFIMKATSPHLRERPVIILAFCALLEKTAWNEEGVTLGLHGQHLRSQASRRTDCKSLFKNEVMCCRKKILFLWKHTGQRKTLSHTLLNLHSRMFFYQTQDDISLSLAALQQYVQL